MRNGKLWASGFAACLALAFIIQGRAVAQEPTNLSLPTDRTLGVKFGQLEGLIEKEQFNEVTLFLGNLLSESEDGQQIEDAFFLSHDNDQPRGLKAEAQRILGQLPPKGRAAFELQFGVRAEKLLTEAVGAGSPAMLEEVSRRYFHTLAGYQATFLLGLYSLDQGHPLAAAHTFEMLLEEPQAKLKLEPSLSLRAATSWLWAGKPEHAREILVAWKKSNQSPRLQAGGKSVPLFTNDAEAVIWLSKLVGTPVLAGQAPANSWTMYRGDATRNSQTTGGIPLFSKRWQVRVANDPTIEKFVSGLETYARRREVALIPAFHPLAVGNVVVARTVRDLMAIDFETGKRLWEVRSNADDGFERLVRAGHRSSRGNEDRSQLVEHLGRRIWDDTAFGTISSDGQRVFALQDLALIVSENYSQGIFFGGPQQQDEEQQTSNRLVALALQSGGETLWELGGPESAEESLKEAFFLGAPLPLEGRLYTLAEIKGGIRLLVIEAESGQLLWSQQLADVEFNVAQHSQRRLAGATPSYGNGILVCPVGAGAVVAVELSSRSLKWAYRYTEKENLYGQGIFGGRYQVTTERENDRWVDNTPTIIGDKVILTPTDSTRLHCLNLFDGSEIWPPKRRGDNLYVACVHHRKIVLVGAEHLTAIDLNDGAQAWPEGMLSLPVGGLPSGRGFYSGKYYYLPMATAEVAKIDLDTGKIVASAKARDGRIPGNLICHDGMVLSQNVDYLDKYFQLEPLEAWVQKRLKENPEDALAILRQGQIKLERSEVPGAIHLLRQAFKKSQEKPAEASVQLESKEMLVQGLLEGLRLDFATYRPALAELEPLMDQADQQIAFLRVKAAGFQKIGETSAAFPAYLELLALEEPANSPLEVIAAGHQARRDRWISAQLVSLYASANAETIQQMNEIVEARLDKLSTETPLPELRSAFHCYAFHPDSSKVALKLSDRLLAEKKNLEAELLLETLRESDTAEVQAAATLRLAKLFNELTQHEQAGQYYQELKTKYADVVCLPGKTGKEIVANLPETEQIALRSTSVKRTWATGEVTANARSGAGDQMYRNSQPLEVRGDAGSYFRKNSLTLEQQPLSIAGFDGNGRERFKIPLQNQDQSFNYDVDPSTTFASAKGRLLFISMGSEIMAVDTLHTHNAGRQNILWKQDLNEYATGLGMGARFMHLKHVKVPGGTIRIRAEDGNGNPVGNIGPITSDTVIIQRHDALLAVHAFTGETLWVRREMPLGCDLFGDAEILLAVPPNSTEARVFRTTDGTELGTCAVASESKRVATIGRRVVAYSRSGGKIVLAMLDPWAKQTLWSETLERSTEIWNIQDESVGAMEPSGRFRLFQLHDGSTLIDQQLEPEQRMSGIVVLAGRDEYTLIAHHNAALPNPEEQIAPVPGDPTDPPLLTGRVYAFSKKSGEPLWPGPATIAFRGLRFPQHQNLPVLIFVQNVIKLSNNEGKATTTVMCLDKRTGKAVYQNNKIRSVQRANFDYRSQGNPSAGTVTISLPISTITLKFTDQPEPPEPPEQESPVPKGKQGSKGLFGIFGSTLKALGTPPEDRDGDVDLFPEEEEEE